MFKIQLLFAFLFFGNCALSFQGFRSSLPSSRYSHTRENRMKPIKAFDLDSFLLAAEVATKPDGYQYGAVSAPGWILPLGAVLAILTAAVPILLRPGEAALDQQRIDEASTNSQFNKRKNKDLR